MVKKMVHHRFVSRYPTTYNCFMRFATPRHRPMCFIQCSFEAFFSTFLCSNPTYCSSLDHALRTATPLDLRWRARALDHRCPGDPVKQSTAPPVQPEAFLRRSAARGFSQSASTTWLTFFGIVLSLPLPLVCPRPRPCLAPFPDGAPSERLRIAEAEAACIRAWPASRSVAVP